MPAVWDAHLQADEGEGEALPPEVLQQLPEPQHHRVVEAADVAALQDRAARWGHCRNRRGQSHREGEAWARRGHGQLRPGGRSPGAATTALSLLPKHQVPEGSGAQGNAGETPPSLSAGSEGPGPGDATGDAQTSSLTEGRAWGPGSRLGAEGTRGARTSHAAIPAGHVPPRARLVTASRRASTAGKCRPPAGCTTSTGHSDTWHGAGEP